MCATSRPRVLIADDHILVADALERLLIADFDVVAKVYDGRSLIRNAQSLRPDAILVDIGMPLLNGLNAAERIKRITPKAKIIYVTINRDPEVIAESLRRGADGYVLKTSAASELVNAIRSALRGDCYISAALEACAPQCAAERAVLSYAHATGDHSPDPSGRRSGSGASTPTTSGLGWRNALVCWWSAVFFTAC